MGSPIHREHEIEQFPRHIEHVRTLGEEARPCLTDRDRRLNIRGHQASRSGSRSEESKNHHLRDFWRRSIFAFFDSIDPLRIRLLVLPISPRSASSAESTSLRDWDVAEVPQAGSTNQSDTLLPVDDWMLQNEPNFCSRWEELTASIGAFGPASAWRRVHRRERWRPGVRLRMALKQKATFRWI